MGTLRKILVLFAHPAYHRSHANLRLVEAVRDLPDVTLHDLYEEYPDFNIDVRREQDALLAHDIVVFQHPLLLV
jgi:glutathione-regulated potassium-efflux system ancillary protein KefG